MKSTEREREYSKKYYQEHKDKCRVYHKDYYQAHKLEYLERQREWYKINSTPELRQARCNGTKRWRDGLRSDVISHYGNKCACCGEIEEAFLTIDHIDGGGEKHRKKIGGGNFYAWLRNNEYPAGFQTLCWNCNMAKFQRGKCPHKKG